MTHLDRGNADHDDEGALDHLHDRVVVEAVQELPLYPRSHLKTEALRAETGCAGNEQGQE